MINGFPPSLQWEFREMTSLGWSGSFFNFPHFSPSPVALFYGGHGCLSVWEELGRNSGYVAHLMKVCPFCKGRSQNQLSSVFLGGEYHRSVVRSEMSYCWAVGGSLLLREKNARGKYPGKLLARAIAGVEDVLWLLLGQLFAVLPEYQSRHHGS